MEQTKYPRLLAALQDRCLLSASEAESAIRAVSTAQRFAGAEAVMHFGGPQVCIRHAFRQRAVARRYSGSPQWAQWAGVDLPRPSRLPTWHDRVSQMEAIGLATVGGEHYAKFDVRLDCGTVLATAPGPHTFVWFLREGGTAIENLSLPRGAQGVEAIADMTCWKAIYRVDLDRGLVAINRQQAKELARKADPYKAKDGVVCRPGGAVIARYHLAQVRDAYGVFDAQITVEGFEWSLDRVRRPHLRADELALIESSVLDAAIDRTGSLFSKIRTVTYAVAPGLLMGSEDFRAFYEDAQKAGFARLWYTVGGDRHYSPHLPVKSAVEADAWMVPFKQLVRQGLGSLRGVRFGVQGS